MDIAPLSQYMKDLIKRVVFNLKSKDSFALVKATQTYDTWINAWNNLDDKIMYIEDIKNYHKKRLNNKLSAF